jgi:hypothetical protein
MPSFHAGWNLLVGIVVFSATHNPFVRALAVLMPAAMMTAAVLTANHFILDVVAGSAIALACLIGRDWLHARRQGAALARGRPRGAAGGVDHNPKLDPAA